MRYGREASLVEVLSILPVTARRLTIFELFGSQPRYDPHAGALNQVILMQINVEHACLTYGLELLRPEASRSIRRQSGQSASSSQRCEIPRQGLKSTRL